MSDVSREERLARAALTCVAEPGDPVMGALLRTCAPAEIVAALVQGRVPVPATGPAGSAGPGRDRLPGRDWDRPAERDRDLPQGQDRGSPPGRDWDGLPGRGWDGLPGLDRGSRSALDRALRRWAGRLGEAPAEPDLEAWRRAGIRLVCPGDAEWPGQLEVLGDARPWGLWVRGGGDLPTRACARCRSSVPGR